MADEKIQIRIYADGRIEAETKGILGEKCTNYIEVLENLLDAETIESNYTEDFYVNDSIKIRQNERVEERLKNQRSF